MKPDHDPKRQPVRVIPRGWSAGPWPRLSPVILMAASTCTSLVSGGVLSGALFVILVGCLHVLLSDTWSWSHLYGGIQSWVFLQLLSMVLAGISIIVMTFRPGRDPERHARFARARTIARLMAGVVMILGVILWALMSPYLPGLYEADNSLGAPLSVLCMVGVVMLMKAVRRMDEMERGILSEAAALTGVAMISLLTVWTLCERQFDLPGIAAPWLVYIASQVFFTILSSFVFFLRTEKWHPADYLGWDARHERQF